jgi:hypothetical protein
LSAPVVMLSALEKSLPAGNVTSFVSPRIDAC